MDLCWLIKIFTVNMKQQPFSNIPRQSDWLYGTGPSLDTLPGKSGEDVDSQSVSDEDDSDFNDKIERVINPTRYMISVD